MAVAIEATRWNAPEYDLVVIGSGQPAQKGAIAGGKGRAKRRRNLTGTGMLEA